MVYAVDRASEGQWRHIGARRQSARTETRRSPHPELPAQPRLQILVRSTGVLQTLRSKEHPPLIGDFSLNAANSLSAAEYLALDSCA